MSEQCQCGADATLVHVITTPTQPSQWRGKRVGPQPMSTKTFMCLLCAEIHINGDTFDNRRSNLRLCTQSQNMRNRKARRAYVGVKLRGGKYIATYNKKYLATYDDAMSAAYAVNEAIALAGDIFTRPNKLPEGFVSSAPNKRTRRAAATCNDCGKRLERKALSPHRIAQRNGAPPRCVACCNRSRLCA